MKEKAEVLHTAMCVDKTAQSLGLWAPVQAEATV